MLGLLLLIYVINFMDRTIIGIIAQPMKEELRLTDLQLGLLNGLAFAFFYAIMGLPIARLAERWNRARIISISLLFWSAMTAMCGMAHNFLHLIAARIGVGIGEAGCSPAAQSIIADLYPPERRSTALSIYSLGVPLGKISGAVAGGFIASELGWRTTFYLLGIPGMALALFMFFAVPEPQRGAFDARPTGQDETDFLSTARTLLTDPVYIHVAFGASLIAFGGYAMQGFAVPLFLRGYDLSLFEVAATYGVVAGAAAAIGTAGGGWIADRVWKGDNAGNAFVAMVGALLCVPLFLIAFLSGSLVALVVFGALATAVQYLYIGPTYGVTVNLVGARQRATATAVLLLAINLIGLGLGPLTAGLLGDIFAANAFAGDFAARCPGGVALAGSGPALETACRLASFTGIRWSLAVCSLVFGWGGCHYWLAWRRIRAASVKSR